MRSTSVRGARAVALATAAALALVACGGEGDDGAVEGSGDEASGGAAEGGSDATLVFGASADPVVLDGAYVSDGESLRVVRQLFEGAAKAVDLPTGTEMKDVYRRLHDLQREVHALKRELRQQWKGAGGGGGKRRGTAAAEASITKGQGDG